MDPGLVLETTLEGIQDIIVDDLDATRERALRGLDNRDPDGSQDEYAAWGMRAQLALTRHQSVLRSRRGLTAEADDFLGLVDESLANFMTAAESLSDGRA